MMTAPLPFSVQHTLAHCLQLLLLAMDLQTATVKCCCPFAAIVFGSVSHLGELDGCDSIAHNGGVNDSEMSFLP